MSIVQRIKSLPCPPLTWCLMYRWVSLIWNTWSQSIPDSRDFSGFECFHRALLFKHPWSKNLQYKIFWDREIFEFHANTLGAFEISDLQNRRFSMYSCINCQEKVAVIPAMTDRPWYLLRQPISPATKQRKQNRKQNKTKNNTNPSMSFRICLCKLEAIIANANFEVKEYPAKSLSHTSECPEDTYHSHAF